MKKNPVEKLVYLLSKLPGLGPRSARRLCLYLLQDKETRVKLLINALQETFDNTKECEICSNIDSETPCNICTNEARDKAIIAVVETVAESWAIERSGIFKGKYHILGGTLSSTSKSSPEELGLDRLKDRITQDKIEEVIIATNATLEGQTTAFFIMDYLQEFDIKISRLASGIPVGGELDYLDEGTLTAAIASRQSYNSLK